MTEDWVRNSINWLVTKQNGDGGFGESSLSYNNAKYRGVGVSTPTQTAWALFALLEVDGLKGYDLKKEIDSAVKYLENTFDEDLVWVDDSVIGTANR